MNDHTQSLEIAGRLRDAVQALHNLADKVGEARQVREFASERRKNLLAKFLTTYLNLDQSYSKAESLARVHPDYLEGLRELEEQQLIAEKLIAKYDAEKCRYEAARSLLSFSRTVADNLQG